MIRASAPGKLVLCGEYAVLGGAPAIVAAVNRRATVTVARRDAGASRVTAPGFLPDSHDFNFGDDRIDWFDPKPKDGSMTLLEAVFATVFGAGRFQPGALEVVLDTRAFTMQPGNRKLGIGGSAALTVALTSALSRLANDGHPDLQIALTAHRRFQSGRGSGVDIAASSTGGIIRYVVGDEPATLAWPGGLQLVGLSSRQAASTPKAIDRYLRETTMESVDELAGLAIAAADAWAQADAVGALKAISQFTDSLNALDRGFGLGIFAAGHEEIYQLARGRADIVYKPSGAGGGDIGVAFSTSEAALQEFVVAAEAAGFERIDLAVDPQGVRVEGD